MANIPVPDFSPPRSIDVPTPAPQLQRPDDTVGSAVRGVVRDAMQAVNSIGSQLQRASLEADNLAVNDALNQLQASGQTALLGDSTAGKDAAGNPLKPGYLNARGKAADEGAAGVLGEWDKTTDKLANTLNPRQQLLFKQHAARLGLKFRAEVETHAAKEFRQAQVDTAATAAQLYIDEAGAGNVTLRSSGEVDPTTGLTKTTWSTHDYGELQRVEGALRAAAGNKAAGDAAVAKFHQAAAVADLQRHLGLDDVEGAKEKLNAYKVMGWLGSATQNAEVLVDKADKAAQKAALKERLAGFSRGLVQQATDAEAFVDDVKAQELLEKHLGEAEDLTEVQKDAARLQLQKDLTAAKKTEAERLKPMRGQALEAFARGGLSAVDDELASSLEKHDAEWWGRLQLAEKRRQQAAAARARGDTRAAEKAARDAAALALNEFKARSDAERISSDLNEWRAMYGLDDLGVSKLKVVQRQSITRTEKGFDKDASGFASALNVALRAKNGPGKGAPLTAEGQTAKRALADDWYNAFVQREGRAPNPEEQNLFISTLKLKREADVKTETGLDEGITPRVAPLRTTPVGGIGPKPKASPKKQRPTVTLKDGSKMMLSDDGKSWVPVP